VNVEENGQVLWYKVGNILEKHSRMSNQVMASQTRDLTETEIVDSLVVSADVFFSTLSQHAPFIGCKYKPAALDYSPPETRMVYSASGAHVSSWVGYLSLASSY
jgi:hypothetical protein